MNADTLLATFILIFASLDVAGWFQGQPVPQFLVRSTWWVMYLGVLVRLFQRFGTSWVRWLVTHQALLVAILAIAVLSSAWSLAPSESLRTSLSLTATTLTGVYIGYTCAPRQFATVLSVTFAVVIVASLAAMPLLPSHIVIEPVSLQWRGLTDHKNSLGAIAVFALVFYIAPIFRGAPRSLSRLALCGACILALVLSRSVTALVACGAGLTSLAWVAAAPRVRRAPSPVRVGLAAVLAAALVATVVFIGPVTRALGKDATFHGRTPLWAASLDMIRERPFTGYGYHAVWGKGAGSLLPYYPATTFRSAATAHNAVLNTATELGTPAAALLVACLTLMFVNASRFRRRNDSSLSLFVMASLVVMATLSLAESYLLAAHSMQWILCVATAVMLRRAIES